MDFSSSVRDALSRVNIRNLAFINGRFCPAASGETFECYTPIDGSLLTNISACGPADVTAAVTAARNSFEDGTWSRSAPKHRKNILFKFAELLEENAEELALLETLDMGKPIRNTRAADIPLVVGTIRYYAEAIDKVYDEIGPSGQDALSMIVREPLGVVGAVTPWNFPLLMASWKFAPALATGNSVIMKPAEQASLTILRAAELALEAGVPPGVFNVLPGSGAVAGEALCLDMDVDGIVFTGSTNVGKRIMGYAAQSNLKRVALECGGKSAHIVMADCSDLDAAAEAAASAIFYDQGQVCTAGSRLLVEESIKGDFLKRVGEVARTFTVGNPLDADTNFGALVDKKQLSTVLSYIEKGREQGATLLCGGDQVNVDSGGWYVNPTIFDGVQPDMTIAQEEIFGPVLSAISFKSFDEAIHIANDSIYGLAAGIWTSDINKAHHAGRRLRAGNVWINCWDGSDITTPFGGFKQSGFGRDRSLHAFDKYTELKTIWLQLSEPD